MDGTAGRRLVSGAIRIVSVASLICANCPAEESAPGRTSSRIAADLAAALEKSKTQDVPTLVVATSSSNPHSKAYFRELSDGPWARSQRGFIQIVEMPVEATTVLPGNQQVTATPTVFAYSAGPDGVACRGRKAGGSVASTIAWLNNLGDDSNPVASPSLRPDSGITQASFDATAPSSQQPAQPPAPVAPQPMMQPLVAPQPQPQLQPQMVPMMMVPQPMVAQPSTVQLPSQDIVVQQAQPRVFFAQPAATPAAQPIPMYANAAQPIAAAAPLFLPVAQPMMAAPAPAPVASPMVGFAPAPAVAMPAGAQAGMTTQTLSVPSSRSTTRIRVRGPGPIRSGLASLGERLVQLGKSTIETRQETELNTPAVLTSGGQVMMTASAPTPVAGPQLQTMVAPPAPVAPEYEPPTPSPQGTATGHRHFLKKHH